MKKQHKLSYHMWTKEEIKLIAKLWDTKSTMDIAEELGIRKPQVQYMAMMMRKEGIRLARKSTQGYVRRLISEVAKEIKR